MAGLADMVQPILPGIGEGLGYDAGQFVVYHFGMMPEPTYQPINGGRWQVGRVPSPAPAGLLFAQPTQSAISAYFGRRAPN